MNNIDTSASVHVAYTCIELRDSKIFISLVIRLRKSFPRLLMCMIDCVQTVLSSDNSDVAPPDPIPNSEVKCVSADGSVGVPM